jgi:hypothetical protein
MYTNALFFYMVNQILFPSPQRACMDVAAPWLAICGWHGSFAAVERAAEGAMEIT